MALAFLIIEFDIWTFFSSCAIERVTHLLSRATLLPSTQLSCSWTHSAVLCKSAARPAVGGGLGLLWLASELRLREVIDGCCLCGGGAGGIGGGACWLVRLSPKSKHQTDKRIAFNILISGSKSEANEYLHIYFENPELRDDRWLRHADIQYVTGS